MTRLLRLLLAMLLGACLAAPALAQDLAATPERQIMVMLAMPPAHLRSGSGGYSGGYGDDASRGARLRAAGRIARAHGLSLIENWPMPGLGIDCFIMAVPGNASIEEAVKSVEQDKAVAWSEPVEMYSGKAHDDALFAAQPAARQWQLASLHRTLTGRNVTVAVIDSGVDTAHPDLAGRIALDRNFTANANMPENHGTAVAGIIAARADNKVGIVGVAPDARIMALRACWQGPGQGHGRTVCDSFSLAKAIQFAIDRKSPIINLSLGGPPSRLLAILLRQGIDQGSTIVAAYDPQLPGGGFPASLPGVVAVSDNISARSSTLVYYAPGQGVPAPQPGGQWTLVDGSSFSAAHISGLFALLRQQHRARAPLVTSGPGNISIDICATFGSAICGSASR